MRLQFQRNLGDLRRIEAFGDLRGSELEREKFNVSVERA